MSVRHISHSFVVKASPLVLQALILQVSYLLGLYSEAHAVVTAGQYLLLGCDLSQGSNRNMDNCISLSALRMTEVLEFILAHPDAAASSATSAAPSSSSGGSGFSSLFNWGSSSSSKNNNTNNSNNSKQESSLLLSKVRAALCPLKLRFALLLADFGLTREAADYARAVRAIVHELDPPGEYSIVNSTV